jgi:uncharacterized YkwD family protein/spore coat assembly protein SafA
VKQMLKKVLVLFALLSSFLFFLSISSEKGNEAQAQGTDQYRVQRGDSMWKIALKYQIGISEIINANKQVPNPNLIYPNQLLNIPNIDNIKGVEQQVLSLVNQERSKNGLPALAMDWELQRVARYKSDDMQNKGYFSHQSPTYGSPFDMMKQFGVSYRTAGENIAKGQRTPQEVMNSWMNSSGHRANILKRDFTHIGVGYNASGHVWTQMFIGK